MLCWPRFTAWVINSSLQIKLGGHASGLMKKANKVSVSTLVRVR